MPRDDYKEFLELIIVFLGSTPSRRQKVSFREPGAIHRARWMGRAIYSLKMWLFWGQYEKYLPTRSSSRSKKVKNPLKTGLTEFCIFIAEHYVRPWFTAMCPAMAPRTDLNLFKRLADHPNSVIRHAASNKIAKHLWYLSEVTVGLSLFDDGISVECKRHMVNNLQSVEGSATPPPRIMVEPDAICNIELPDFLQKQQKPF